MMIAEFTAVLFGLFLFSTAIGMCDFVQEFLSLFSVNKTHIEEPVNRPEQNVLMDTMAKACWCRTRSCLPFRLYNNVLISKCVCVEESG